MTKQTIMQAMRWRKYSFEQWLEQYDAWINSERMQTGNCPDNLRVNQLWVLMKSKGSAHVTSSKKKRVTCEIDDNEARAVQRLLLDTMRDAEDYFKVGIICLYKHSAEGKGLRQVGRETNQSKDKAHLMVNIGKTYLHAKHPFLHVDFTC